MPPLRLHDERRRDGGAASPPADGQRRGVDAPVGDDRGPGRGVATRRRAAPTRRRVSRERQADGTTDLCTLCTGRSSSVVRVHCYKRVRRRPSW